MSIYVSEQEVISCFYVYERLTAILQSHLPEAKNLSITGFSKFRYDENRRRRLQYNFSYIYEQDGKFKADVYFLEEGDLALDRFLESEI